MTTISLRFKDKQLGTLWKSNKRKGTYRLRRLPIKNNQHESRIIYLLNLNDPHDFITECDDTEEWTPA